MLASRRVLTVGQPVDLDISGLRPERSVSLEGYARPSSAYTTFRTPTQPAADGTLRFTVQPTTSTRLRVRVEHCPEPGTSQVLIVHARLSLQVARVGPRHYVFSGSIAPGRVNAGRSVSLFYRTASGATLRRGYTTVSADGTYRLDIRFSGVGRLAFFTQTGSNTINAAATSPARSVLVS